MTLSKRKQAYLFARHSVEEVRSWNRRLRYFRYFRAHGGHANDADSLDLAIAYRGSDDLLSVLEQLGIIPKQYSSAPPQAEAGVKYVGMDREKFPSVIPGTRWIEQPGHTEIFGSPVFVWCHRDRIVISLGGESWEVDEKTVAAAETIEPHLDSLADRVLDPPGDSDHYLCVARHPFLGSGNAECPEPPPGE